MLYNFLASLFRPLLKLIYGLELTKNYSVDEGPVVVVANHKSMLDPILISVCFNRQIHWMAKKELFKNKLFGKLIETLGAFPVDRDGSDLRAMKTAMKLLKDEQVLGVFPEGTRVKDIDVNRGKSGAALLASRMNATIVPVYVKGDYKLFGKTEVIFRQPLMLEAKKRSEQEYKADIRRIMEIIYFGGELSGDTTS